MNDHQKRIKRPESQVEDDEEKYRLVRLYWESEG